VWVQPTRVVDYKLQSDDKRKYLADGNLERFRNVTRTSAINSINKLGSVILETDAACNDKDSTDGT
jgi:hypothetical protein